MVFAIFAVFAFAPVNEPETRFAPAPDAKEVFMDDAGYCEIYEDGKVAVECTNCNCRKLLRQYQKGQERQEIGSKNQYRR